MIFLTTDKQLDNIFKKISPKQNIKVGDVIYGKVRQANDKMVFVNINRVEGKQKVLTPSSDGVLFARDIAHQYVEVGDCFKKGDIIRAKVIDIDKFGIKLSTADNDLGVIKANCLYCRKPLNLKHAINNEVKCLNCKAVQKKKIAKV